MQELFVALFLFLCLCLLPLPVLAKTFGGALIGAFLGSFLEAFGSEFSFAFVLPGMWKERQSKSLSLLLPLGVLGGTLIAYGNDEKLVS